MTWPEFHEKLAQIDETGDLEQIDRWSGYFDRALAQWHATHPDSPSFNSGQDSDYWADFEIEVPVSEPSWLDAEIRVCKICGGVEGGMITGGEVDPITGLCITCQPCPRCGKVDHDPLHETCPEAWADQ